MKARRTQLWEIAGVRGYPLVFIQDQSGVDQFIGDFDVGSALFFCWFCGFLLL
jgi:hypothetical protein